MIQSAVTSRVQTGRQATPAAAARAGAAAGGASFASLLGDGGGDTDPAPTATAPQDAPATDRQDDAATGNPAPALAIPLPADAGWLSLILAGTPAVLPPPVAAPGGNPATSSPPVAAAAPPIALAPTVSPPGSNSATSSPPVAAAAPPVALAGTVSPPLPGLTGAPDACLVTPPPANPPVFSQPPSAITVPLPVTAAAALSPSVAATGQPVPTIPGQQPAPATPDEGRTTDPRVRSAAPVAAATTLPQAAAVRPFTVAPAAEVFAAAIHAAGRDQAAGQRDGNDGGDMQAIPLAATSTPVAGIVAAAGDRGDASLDMSHGGWPSAMVDHIEKLRDAADATDTRIRVVPDALGSIDVSLSRHADGVHVTLAADQPATQAMLAEARPQLTELAQARGLRLTDTSVGGGSQGFGDGQRQQPLPTFMPGAPVSAATLDDNRDPADGRVA